MMEQLEHMAAPNSDSAGLGMGSWKPHAPITGQIQSGDLFAEQFERQRASTEARRTALRASADHFRDRAQWIEQQNREDQMIRWTIFLGGFVTAFAVAWMLM